MFYSRRKKKGKRERDGAHRVRAHGAARFYTFAKRLHIIRRENRLSRLFVSIASSVSIACSRLIAAEISEISV